MVVDGFDPVIAGKARDLCDSLVWEPLLEKVETGHYHGCGGGAPCSSFSAGRNANVGGPRPVRTDKPPGIFGIKDLKPAEKESVREGTLLAHRKATMAELCYSKGLPFGAETPQRREGCPSVFKLPRFLALESKDGVSITAFVQCHLGARTPKPTDIL